MAFIVMACLVEESDSALERDWGISGAVGRARPRPCLPRRLASASSIWLVVTVAELALGLSQCPSMAARQLQPVHRVRARLPRLQLVGHSLFGAGSKRNPPVQPLIRDRLMG